MRAFRFLPVLVLMAVCHVAIAQWVWIDNDGRKVFSDRVPPPEIPDKNILTKPERIGRAQPQAVTASAPASASPPAAGASSAAKTLARDPALEARKKQLEQDEKAKVQAENEKQARVKAQNCQEARRGMQTLQSGVRMQSINANGESEIMDDNTRSAEIRRVQALIDSQCE